MTFDDLNVILVNFKITLICTFNSVMTSSFILLDVQIYKDKLDQHSEG